jgi:serine/threonine protein phosphatase 1
MTFNFRNLFTKGDLRTEPSIPRGYRVYAVGDVHGRLDLLDECLTLIENDIAARHGSEEIENIIVFLGDLVDRGPSSAQVVERVRTYSRPATRTVFLSGNHEEVLLRLLRGEGRFLGDWLRFGGAECARSYGIDPSLFKRLRSEQGLALLREKIPEEHQDFLASFVDTVRIGDYLFVHAGVRPGVPLPEQSQTDLRWIREPFLRDPTDHGFVVVHGHTIAEQVDVCANRIGIDTGAYRTGVLTALALEGTERRFLQTGIDGARSDQAPAMFRKVASENLDC